MTACTFQIHSHKTRITSGPLDPRLLNIVNADKSKVVLSRKEGLK